jgi:putative nucleotidyltransferase with HDIG domain
MTWNPLDSVDHPPVDVSQPTPDETPILVVDDEEAISRSLTRLLERAADTDTAVESLRLGVEDYLTKPIERDALLESVQRSLRRRAQAIYRRRLEQWLRDEVGRRTRELPAQLASVTVTILADVVRAMEKKDLYLNGHSDRVARIASDVARRMGLEENAVEAVRAAGLLHDLGMVGVSDDVLHKEGKLSDAEYATVKQHPRVGADLLERHDALQPVADYVRHHHERLNGSGYPGGLRGRQIPLGAQILGLAESFVSITESRSFRPAYSPEEALEVLRGSEGVWYERRLIELLAQVIQYSVISTR